MLKDLFDERDSLTSSRAWRERVFDGVVAAAETIDAFASFKTARARPATSSSG